MEGQATTAWKDLGPDFIRRVLRTTGLVGALVALCVAVYAGMRPALSWSAGVALGMADLAVLDWLIRELVGRRRPRTLLIAFLLKFAGLYAIGAALLHWADLPPVALLLGFPLFLAVVILKVLGGLLVSARWMSRTETGKRARP